jgi:hypothetical protein
MVGTSNQSVSEMVIDQFPPYFRWMIGIIKQQGHRNRIWEM